jgi:S1-C subfamily serine protease
MVLTSNGLVLTNNHVVEGATSISVTDIGNGKTYNAKVVGYDRTKDVAVLQLINASNLATVSLSTSGVTVGEEVVAVGNAGGSGGQPSYAQGTISATGQSITASDEATGGTEQLTGLIETNADIVAGDSGGPLVNSDGQVIAMDTAAAQGFQFQSSGNQGYSIPINEADGIAKLIKAGTASATVHVGSTAFLGVTVQEATSQDGSSAASGAQIYQVIKGGPAAAAGLESGDTITELGGKSVTSPEDLTNVILSEKAGNSVQVVYTDANGATQTTTVQLGSGPPQ